MYTIAGLKMIADSSAPSIPVGYLRDAIAHVQNLLTESEKGMSFLKEQFHQTLAIDLTPYQDSLYSFIELADSSTETVEKKEFVIAVETAENLLTLHNQVFATLKYAFSTLDWHKLPEPQYYALPKGKDAFHQLGMLNRSFDDFITVTRETDEFYIGSFWVSSFFDVYFRKCDVRPLTKEERLEANI